MKLAQTLAQTNRQTDKQIDTQTHRQTDRQTQPKDMCAQTHLVAREWQNLGLHPILLKPRMFANSVRLDLKPSICRLLPKSKMRHN